MLFIRFLRYLRGHVKFFARSGSFERLINLCAHHRVPLWDCRREEAGYSGRTTVDGYRRMRPLARKAGAVTRVKAVSYTHLDVYKRQRYYSSFHSEDFPVEG